jgi:hypothetical protein
MEAETSMEESVLVFSPVAQGVQELCGDAPLESFEIEYFAEDLDRIIFNEKIKTFHKAAGKAMYSQGLDISYFIYMNEETYTWNHLQ